MPILQNARHEAFAQARAAGARLDDAYEDAGFAYGRGHSSRLAATPEVAERIAELRAARAAETDASEQAVIAALLRIAKAGLREVRLTLIEAQKLYSQQAQARAFERIESLY
jgi:phage terminase small subunit